MEELLHYREDIKPRSYYKWLVEKYPHMKDLISYNDYIEIIRLYFDTCIDLMIKHKSPLVTKIGTINITKYKARENLIKNPFFNNKPDVIRRSDELLGYYYSFKWKRLKPGHQKFYKFKIKKSTFKRLNEDIRLKNTYESFNFNTWGVS